MKIQICSKDYDIRMGDQEQFTYFGVYGFYSEHTQSIHIAEDLENDTYCETLLHEILHAIHRETGINLPHEEEEKIVNLTAKGLRSVIKGNDKETVERILYGY